MADTSFLGRATQHRDIMDTDGFVDYLFSDLGQKELRSLNETSLHALWKHSFAVANQRQESTRRQIMEYLLEVVPESLVVTGNNNHKTVFHLALEANERIPEDLLIRMVHNVPVKRNIFRSTSRDMNRKTPLHPWVVATREQVPVNVLREIHNVSRSSDIVLFKNQTFSSFCCDIGFGCIEVSNRTLEILHFLLSVDPMLAKVRNDKNGLPFHSLLDGWLNSVKYDHHDPYDEHTTIMCQIGDLLLDANPLALEIPMSGGTYKRKNEIPLVRACRLGSNATIHRNFESRKQTMASRIIIYILKKCPKTVLFEDLCVDNLEVGSSTPLEFLQGKLLAQQLLLEIKGSVEIMNALSTLRHLKNGDTILHILSNFKTTSSAQLEHKKTIDDAIIEMYDSMSYMSRIINAPREPSKLIYHGLIVALPKLTMLQNLNGDLPLHVRLKAEETKDCFEDVKLLTSAYDRAKAKTGDGRNDEILVSDDTYYTGTGIPSFVVAALFPANSSVATIYFLLQRYVGNVGGLQDYTS